MKRLGVIGLSDGNGHPFSFSAILNGYSDEGFANSGWPIIHEYLKKKAPEEFKSIPARVTHAWTQDPNLTEKLCIAANIPNRVSHIEDMLADVDAIILARDDFETHREIAAPILKRGIPVFVDKPLCATHTDLNYFMPYLESGQVVSFSSMRNAVELDAVKASWQQFGKVKLVQGTILNSWEKYGIHMLDAAFGLEVARPVSMQVTNGPIVKSTTIHLADGGIVQLNALGSPSPRCFRISVFGENKIEHLEITDNFGMFKRTLDKFVRILNGEDHLPDARKTIESISLLIEARNK